MKVTYLDNDYTLEMDEIDVKQARLIKAKCGLTLATLEDGLNEADPDALRAIFWLMTEQSGLHQDIDLINFKVYKFAKALQEATANEVKEQEEREKAEKKAGRAKTTAPKE